MAEIDTKPIESVRSALSLFGDKVDQKKYQPRSQHEWEEQLEEVSKELANCKLQSEAKHAAYMQAILKSEHYQKMTYELSTLLKKSDSERNKYMSECMEARVQIDEHKSKMEEMAGQLSENVKVQEQLKHVVNELKATQRELLVKETELAAIRDSEMNALTKAEHMLTAAKMEKEKKDELVLKVRDLSEVIHELKLAAIKVEKEKSAILSEKDAKIELATKATAEAQKQLEDMRKQLEMLQGLQNQLLEKSKLDDPLKLELQQATELHISSEEFDSNAIKPKEKTITDQSIYIEELEMELNQLKQELVNAKKEINGLNINIESLEGELQKAKEEMHIIKEREIKAQVEIALLKSQLHGGRLEFAGIEDTEELKMQNYSVKQGENQVPNKAENPFQKAADSRIENSKAEAEEINNEKKDDLVTITMKEFEALLREAEKANEVRSSVVEVGSQSDVALLKKELEAASAKIGELRARAEQALSRAELAEKAKAALEDKIKRHRDQRHRRKAALDALREESTPKQFSPSTSDGTPKVYQPLGHFLFPAISQLWILRPQWFN